MQQFMPGAVADIIRRAPLTQEKIAFAWRSSVGQTVDHVTSVELRDGILHVRARDAAWAREVERSAAMIRARLDSLLGEGIVRRIRVAA